MLPLTLCTCVCSAVAGVSVDAVGQRVLLQLLHVPTAPRDEAWLSWSALTACDGAVEVSWQQPTREHVRAKLATALAACTAMELVNGV